jgi:hypothetical protein
MYGYKEEDTEYQKEIRPIKLAIERDELIRDFVISHHLLTEEFLNSKLINYFIKQKPRSRRYNFFEEFILQKMFYQEKIDLVYKANLISKTAYNFLCDLNSLRRMCAHRWFLKDKKIRLLYRKKDILGIDNFREFADNVFTMHESLWEV